MHQNMHIICCIKQVPDTAQVKIDPDTNTLIRSGVESICNPYDLVAVEAAVQLIEKHGGKVTVIAMGPPQAESALRDGLALGAHEAILLSHRAFAGADTLATSYTLATAITKIATTEPVHLIMCGKMAIDGDTGQTGPGIATRLGCTLFTYVSEIREFDLESGYITVRREIEGGSEIVRGKIPALLTVELQLGTPRYASLPELMRSLREDIKVWGADDIEALPERLGVKGSPTLVKGISAPEARKGGLVFNAEENDKAVDDFLDRLFDREAALLGGILSKTEDTHA
jgi:electron transfer flavoprotein beta subunit